MNSFSNSTYARTILAMRPDVSPEQEAELSGLSVDEILALRQRLDNASSRVVFDKAWGANVLALSVSLADASNSISIGAAQLANRAGNGSIRAFKHHGRWRIWLSDLKDLQNVYSPRRK